MPIPHDPRVRAVLEAVAAAMAHCIPSTSDAHKVTNYNDLLYAIRAVFPDADAIRAFAAAGIRTSEDAQYDPRPGDTFVAANDDEGGIYTVAVRYKDHVVYDHPDGAPLGCTVTRWAARSGTFTPAAQ